MDEEKKILKEHENTALVTREAATPALLPEWAGSVTQTKQEETESESPLTEDQKDALEMIRALAPKAVEKLIEMLDRDDVKPTVKVRICEMILDRTYGKPEASVKVTSVEQTITQSREYVMTLVQSIRESVPVQKADHMP